MHRNHPQGIRMIVWKYCVFRTQHDPSEWPFRLTARATGGKIHPTKSFTAPLNPRRPTVGAPPADQMQRTQPNEQPFPVRQVGRTAGRPPIPQDKLPSHAPRDAPEPDSHFQRTNTTTQVTFIGQPLKRRAHITRDALPRPMITPNSGHSAIQRTLRQPMGLCLRPAVIHQTGSGSHRLQANDCRRERT
jgi:hypothetical protein